MEKFLEWIYPKKIKLNELPEICSKRIYIINFAFIAMAIVSLIISTISVSPQLLIALPILFLLYIYAYFEMIRPFLNNEVIVYDGEVISITQKNSRYGRRSITIKVNDIFFEFACDDITDIQKGNHLAIFVNKSNVYKKTDSIYRIVKYYYLEKTSY